MRKRVLSIMIMGLILVPFLFSAVAAKTLKIGSMSPLTGPYASDGTDIKNGARAAIEVFEEAGGMPGYDKIEFFPQDTACDPRQAVAAANKLINLEVVGVIGAYCSSSTIPSSETLDEEDVIMITPASTNEKVTDRGLPYMFRMCGRDDDQAPAAAKFLKESLGAKTIFIVDDKTTYSQGLADGVKKASIALGMEVVAHEHVNQGDKDFSAILTMAKRANADVFYMSLQGYSPAAMMTLQAKRLGMDSQIVTQDAVFQPKYMDVAKEASQGVYLTYGFTDQTTPQYKAFEERYVPKYGKIAAYATYAYDAATALLYAIKAAGSTDPEKVKAELMKLDFQGVAKKIKFNAKGDSGSSYIAYKVVGDKFVPYWEPVNGLIK
ncbi:MAG: branched-chain amino acid ABC transporter substrate-binding protein [Desulfobacula sp.]|jgi:branched-chain amino acid transport system substrate-binding protein|uniref:branched-chain amino acid ABC transporter substrate-binding protein n=2 Tax=Desulfobacula sp. TaxID=2593537 RepID=UPI001D7A6B74|nr:branched-chain amino acid ABC transporter substrate-binding protein [Desulfobacula sp.]MBT3807401.1 branched-chain amino acid ABC transporter substrate-binding protein [Desulfobacula sp.]MBT4027401.1 branched-chain amino acid ABC transporter substrate-binding protein [Desulfobacula sp.]MBT4873615.1 branched-chain amino acid ABC transporter substrate-binding protein [Desulfobacula sp.]MBT5545459.1 branched-chain amino acid ABC transporter substrate-binding protein [Desulfobacula sp.]